MLVYFKLTFYLCSQIPDYVRLFKIEVCIIFQFL